MRKLAETGLFIALGIVLPIGFHAVGMGKVFLPMHIPVLLAGIYVGVRSGLVVGIATPILSAVLTGMPALVPPIAFAMMVELPIYGVLAALFYRRAKLHPALAVSLAGLIGRVAYGVVGYTMFPLLGLPEVGLVYPITAGLVASLPGIVLQIVVVPLVVTRLKP